MLLAVTDGFILSFPPETMPCPRCGSTDHEVQFRGWSRVTGFVWFTRETRMSAYLCAGCRQAELAKVLWWNALLGAGGRSGRGSGTAGGRSTSTGGRCGRRRASRGKWGAMNATEFAEGLRALHAEAIARTPGGRLRTERPLAHLTEAQMGIVLAAGEKYMSCWRSPRPLAPTSCATPTANRPRASHEPDLHAGSTKADERMRALNNAWEILGKPPHARGLRLARAPAHRGGSRHDPRPARPRLGAVAGRPRRPGRRDGHQRRRRGHRGNLQQPGSTERRR